MNMEKLSDMQGGSPETTSKTPQSISEEQNEVRTVALYFMDPDDALAVHGEMKQMEQMESADIRLTSFSLAKALRQASNLGGGLPTGAPPNPLTGSFEAADGAMLRYKIVPPKRQLFYAARCIGKERVGLFGETAAEDAQTVVMGNSALEGANLMRRREKRERKTPKKKARTPMQVAAAHMEGYTGIPVFYCPQMRRRLPKLKHWLTGQREETPLFFNYEDMEQAWSQMRQKRRRRENIPAQPVDVEVFNLWDVLTSMDKSAWKNHKPWWKQDLLAPLQRRFGKPSPLDLRDITFVPSSRSVQYKESITARGNGKARLPRMR